MMVMQVDTGKPRCKSKSPFIDYSGFQCELAQAHDGPHSYTVVWRDEPE